MNGGRLRPAATGCRGALAFAFRPLFRCSLAHQSIHSRRKVNKFIVDKSSKWKVRREGGEVAKPARDQMRGGESRGGQMRRMKSRLKGFSPGFRRKVSFNPLRSLFVSKSPPARFENTPALREAYGRAANFC